MGLEPEQAWLQSLPADLQDAINLTNQTTGRDVAVFQRTYNGTLYLMFQTVPPEYQLEAATVSSMGVALDVLLDFWADTQARADLVAGAKTYMLEGENPSLAELSPLVTIWGAYQKRVQQAPLYARFRPLLMQEWAGLLEAMRYAVLVNTDQSTPYNYAIAVEKFAPNMHHNIKHVVDMCFSPAWDEAWTSPALALAQDAQVVTRIGNWLKSWKQELRVHRDITSGVFALALEQGVVSRAEVLDPSLDPEPIIQKIETTPIEALGGHSAVSFIEAEAQRIISAIEQLPAPPYMDTLKYAQALHQVILDQSKGDNEKR